MRLQGRADDKGSLLYYGNGPSRGRGDRAAVIRAAIDRELRRREAAKARRKGERYGGSEQTVNPVRISIIRGAGITPSPRC
jgi:hypothetical protein